MRKIFKNMRFWLSAAVCVAMVSGCSTDDVIPDPIPQEDVEEPVEWEEWSECNYFKKDFYFGVPHDRFEMKYFKTACAMADPDENVVVWPAGLKVMLAELGEASDEACRKEIARQMGYESFDEVIAARDFYINGPIDNRYVQKELGCTKLEGWLVGYEKPWLMQGVWFDAAWDAWDKGAWDKYYVEDVSSGTFNHSPVQVAGFSDRNSYVKTDTYQAFNKTVGLSDYVVVFILPEEGVDVNDVIRDFDPELLERNCCGDITLRLPIFDYTHETDINATLEAIGFKHLGEINLLQETKINLTKYGMSEEPLIVNPEELTDGFPLWVDTEATMTFDRPFILFVTENSTGGCLMAAKIAHL